MKLEPSLEQLVAARVRAERWGVVYDLRDLLRGIADRQSVLEGQLEALKAAVVFTNNNGLASQQVIVTQLNAILRRAGLNDAIQTMELGFSDDDEPTDP
jgi:hypothetical protein